MTWLKRALPAVALLCLLTSPAFAQITGRPYEFSAGLGALNYDTRARFRDAYSLQGSAGWRVAPWFTAELGGTFGRAYADTFPEPKGSLLLVSADARWNLRPGESRVVPFVLTGWGYGRSNVAGADPLKLARGTPSLGFGALFNLMGRSRWYARVQVRDVMFKERLAYEVSHHIATTAGIHYVFGGRFRDQDTDKVRDWLDSCPDTPPGAAVDATGCPKDSDGDGVLDGLDTCADTPKGCKVDKKGCLIDTDGDGVCDGVDSCATTPKGAKVDDHGCPIDSDGDGVFDGLDQCPDTPKGCTIDDNGCIKDADKDGVCDALDTCADTPAGAQVDDKGCETKASTMEGDLLDTGRLRLTGVEFLSGTATLKSGDFANLDAAGQIIAKWPELNFQVGGHTDDEGKAAANLKLSQARAEAARAWLLQKYPSIKPEQLVAKGFGGTRPVVSNDTEQARALNRRIELTVLNMNALVQSGGKRRLGAK